MQICMYIYIYFDHIFDLNFGTNETKEFGNAYEPTLFFQINFLKQGQEFYNVDYLNFQIFIYILPYI